MTAALWAIAIAIMLSAFIIRKEIKNMANNFSGLFTALDNLAAEADAVAEAIRNPAVDNNDQSVIDELTSRLDALSAGLHQATLDENAEDGVKVEAPSSGGEASPQTSDLDTSKAPASDVGEEPAA